MEQSERGSAKHSALGYTGLSHLIALICLSAATVVGGYCAMARFGEMA